LADHGDLLSKDETLDDLILGGRKIIQSRHGYRFSLDSVLLAHFPDLEAVAQAVDLGTGSGVIPLILGARSPHLKVAGVELQPGMADRARRTMKLNRVEDRITIIEADIREIEKHLSGGYAELVLSNPPFWKRGQGKVSRHPEQAIARHELCLELGEVWSKGAYLLRPGGHMAVIQPVSRMMESLAHIEKQGLGIYRLRMVHAFREREAGLVLLEAVKQKRPALKILPPLIIYDEGGGYSQEILTWYGQVGSEN